MTVRLRSLVFAVTLLAVAFTPGAVRAQTAIPGPCVPGVLPSGARSLICVPEVGWNGELVIFAHGYVAAGLPLDFYNLTLPDGTFLPAIVQALGYAFATTSYRQNGLAILEGVDDVHQLADAFAEAWSAPVKTHLAGASEGGLVVALLAERALDRFTSALAICGPIGSFTAQVDYIGDFRVLFDYFFPGVIPGPAFAIPPDVTLNWDTVVVPRILAALATSPGKALELMRTAKAAYDPSNPATIANTAVNALWYNVFGTNDAVLKLGGNPYANRNRWYFGSSNDLRLNLRIQRVTASPVARAALAPYQTSGEVAIPMVTLHTIADESVPFWQELVYLGKADPVGRGRFLPVPVRRYGHCNFTTSEVLGAFGLAVRFP
jgi:pimeloyl-ACP methyl ester carboxylesterase